jgi:hypothetical protein
MFVTLTLVLILSLSPHLAKLRLWIFVLVHVLTSQAFARHEQVSKDCRVFARRVPFAPNQANPFASYCHCFNFSADGLEDFVSAVGAGENYKKNLVNKQTGAGPCGKWLSQFN